MKRTEYLGLPIIGERAEDLNMSFLQYRNAIAGDIPDSAMKKIDEFAGEMSANMDSVQDVVDDLAEAVGSIGGKTELVYNQSSGAITKSSDGQTVNFRQLIDLLKVSKDFTYILYGERAYLPTLINDDDVGMHYIYFESTMVDGGLSKNAVITVVSSDGVNISGISTSSVANENYNHKVQEITDRNKSSADNYPSVKAVVDYFSPKIENAGKVKSVNGVQPNAVGDVLLTDVELPPQAIDVEARNSIAERIVVDEAQQDRIEEILLAIGQHTEEINACEAGIDNIARDIAAIHNIDTAQSIEIQALQRENALYSHRIANLEAAAEGNLYRVETDNGIAYGKNVPEDVMPWATLDMIGGHSESADGVMVDYAPSKIVSTGRNMLNVTNDTIVRVNNVEDLNGATRDKRHGVYVRIAETGPYYIKSDVNVGLYKAEPNRVYQIAASSKNYWTELEVGEYYILGITSTTESTVKQQFTSCNLMMSPGTTEPVYEPYVESVIDLTDVVQNGFGGVMRSAGDIYDAISVDENGIGWAVKRVGEDHVALETPESSVISGNVPSAIRVYPGGRILLYSDQNMQQLPCTVSYMIKLGGATE